MPPAAREQDSCAGPPATTSQCDTVTKLLCLLAHRTGQVRDFRLVAAEAWAARFDRSVEYKERVVGCLMELLDQRKASAVSAWDATPTDACACGAQPCNEVARLRQEVADVEAEMWRVKVVAVEIRAQGPSNAAAFRVRVLQRAHAFVLAELQQEWDARRFDADADAPASIHSLPTPLLERVLERVPGEDADWQQFYKFCCARPDARMPPFRPEWSGRRNCAQVSRLFEALTYATGRSGHHLIANGLGGCGPTLRRIPRFLLRDVARVALSANLTSLQLRCCAEHAACFDPGCHDLEGVREQLLAAEAALPRCVALRRVEVVADPSPHGRGRRHACSLPPQLLDTLRCCRALRALTLRLGANARAEPVRGAIRGGALSEDELLAVASLPQLTSLSIEGALDSWLLIPAPDSFTAAITSNPRLLELRLLRVVYTPPWPQLVCPNLTSLEVTGVAEWERPPASRLNAALPQLRVLAAALPSARDVCDVAALLPRLVSVTALTLLASFHERAVSAEDLQPLAAALPRMSALRALTLHADSWGGRYRLQEDVCGKVLLPTMRRCAALRELRLQGQHSVDAAWVAALVDALPACAALESLQLVRVSAAVVDAVVSGGLFEALPRCRALAHVGFSETLVSMDCARALCACLPLCAALWRLTLEGAGLDESAGEELSALVANAPGVVLELRR